MNIIRSDHGWLEVIAGPMFSGKTEELIRRVRRAAIARQTVAVFKPAIDDRYDAVNIVSHSEIALPSRPVRSPEEVLQFGEAAQVIGIDEGQFLGTGLVPVVETLISQGKRVIVAGLDLDYRGAPFEPMPYFMATAEYLDKMLAICMQCGEPASRTQRLHAGGGRVVVGATGLYEARCRSCWTNPDAVEPPSEQLTIV